MILGDDDRQHLERLLALGDRLSRLQRAIDDEMSGRRPEGPSRERLRKGVDQALEEGLSGREILEVVFDSSYGILDGAELLEEGSPLRQSGAAAAVEGADSQDALDQWFVLSERLYRAVRREMRRGPARRGGRRETVRPYRDHREHLMDLARLTSLYQRRASRLFGPAPEGDDRPAESLERLQERVREAEVRMQRRMTASEASAGFPILRLGRQHGLGNDEIAALAILLFQEVYTGSSYMPVVELVKAVSVSEEELIEKRALFRKDAALPRSGLVVVEEEPLEREFSAEAYLPSWVVEDLLGSSGKPGITPEARRDFAAYLASLQDSRQFFNDMGEPETDPKKERKRAGPGRGGRGGGRGRGRGRG